MWPLEVREQCVGVISLSLSTKRVPGANSGHQVWQSDRYALSRLTGHEYTDLALPLSRVFEAFCVCMFFQGKTPIGL